jgi:polyadenylate-binding protein 2
MAGNLDIDAIRQRLEKLREQKRIAEGAQPGTPPPTPFTPIPCDDHSVFIGSVDFSVKKEELIEFFGNCGEIVRCTVQTDHYTHKPKGYAYIEFSNLDGVENALKFDGHVLKGRTIQVRRKRANSPQMSVRRRFRRQ